MQKYAHALISMPPNKARENGNILDVFCLTGQLLFDSQGKDENKITILKPVLISSFLIVVTSEIYSIN